jgi:hypothetical protein
VSKLESKFQKEVIDALKNAFPGCLIIKSDSNYIQGFPDLLIFYNDKWASLECKRNAGAARQPNQSYYVKLMDKMSFSRFIYPGNKEEVFRELQQAFKS